MSTLTPLPVLDDAPEARPLSLSKSRFMAGLQCEKRLHLEINSPELQDVLEESEEAMLESGFEIGDLARRLYPGGKLMNDDPREFDRAHAQTVAAMADPDVPAIFEAAFEFDGSRVRADALVRVGPDEFDLVEVKSAGGAKPEHIVDAALQLHVIRGSGVNIRSVRLVHPNKEYVRPPGDLDPQDFFIATDVTDSSEALVPQVMGNLHQLSKVASQASSPTVATGSQCKKPVKCPFYGHCHANLTPYPVGELPFISTKLRGLLAEARIEDIRDIPEQFEGLSANQERIREVVASGVPYHNEEGLKEFFQNIKYPIHFLDFETIQPGIPLYPGTRAYETIPVQWSNHTLMNAKGRVYHKEFLQAEDADPRPRFLKSLIKAVKKDGSIFVYSSFEEKRLLELAAAFPEYADDINNIIGRFVDLLQVMRANVYYPEFHGSFSIKKVLPVLVPGLSYKGLLIKDGAVAAAAYMEILRPTTTMERRAELSTALLAYCRLDTEAMLRLYMKLDVRMQAPQSQALASPKAPRAGGVGRRTQKDVAPTPAQRASAAGLKGRGTKAEAGAASQARTRRAVEAAEAEAQAEAAAPVTEVSAPTAAKRAR